MSIEEILNNGHGLGHSLPVPLVVEPILDPGTVTLGGVADDDLELRMLIGQLRKVLHGKDLN